MPERRSAVDAAGREVAAVRFDHRRHVALLASVPPTGEAWRAPQEREIAVAADARAESRAAKARLLAGMEERYRLSGGLVVPGLPHKTLRTS